MTPRTVLKYPGAKWRVAQWIISVMPPHKSYLEPFFGSGAVFFNKPPSRIETINDLAGREYAYAAKYWNCLPAWISQSVERLKEAQMGLI